MRIFETALLRGPRFLIETSEEWGVPRAQLLREAGLAEAEIVDPDARITLTKLVDLWRAIIFHFPERDAGVRFGRAFDARAAGLLGFLLFNSADLRAGVERIVRFSRILNEGVRPRFQLEPGRAVLSWTPSPFFKPYPQATDWALAALVTSLRQATRSKFKPKEVWLPYDQPKRVPASFRDHFGSSLSFGSDRTGLVFSHRQLALAIHGADADLAVFLERHAEQVLGTLSAGGELVEQVRNRIWEGLRRGRPSLEAVAAALAMSPRSLQRQLHAEGTSFADLRDELLSSLAASMLRDRDMAIDEIAFVLGYSEPGTFYRAFRRWQKTSPHEFRAAV